MRKLALVMTTTLFTLAMATPALAGGGGSLCRGVGDGAEIVMRDNCFAATAHEASPGDVITIVNEGRIDHTYTAVDGSFDTGLVGPGGSVEITVGDAGLVRVFCSLHGTAAGDGMAGLLVVGVPAAAAAVAVTRAAPPATPTPPAVSPLLVAALDRQSAALAETSAQEVALLERLVISGSESAEWPAPLIVVLLGAALGVVGIFAVTRAPRGTGTVQRVGTTGQPEGA